MNLFLLVLTLLCSLRVDAASPLTLDSIHTEMDKIFQEHLSKKMMDGAILTRALVLYINQFDPHHVYLSQEDVGPYLKLSKGEIKELVAAYNDQDYSIFKKLNTTIQTAIYAMRAYRRSLLVDQTLFSKLYQEPLPAVTDATQGNVSSFAATQNEVKMRQGVFMAHEVERELETLIALNRPAVFAEAVRVVEVNLEESENSYLYRDKLGKPLSHDQQAEVFSLHILKALTAALDVHSSFFNPEEAETLRTKLEKEYVGIGLSFEVQGTSFVVSHIVQGSSADKSGKIHIGDELVSIDTTPTRALSLEEVKASLEGKKGSFVDLGMKRAGLTPFHAVLERSQIILQEGRVDTNFEAYDKGIVGIIQLHGFYEGEGDISSIDDMKKALNTLKQKGELLGLVLDLRDNRGGFLQQAVKVAGLFIKTGIIAVAKYSDGHLRFFRDLDPKVYFDGPLIILTSRLTASAAEIVAQSLKEYGVAIIVGDEQTYGKGSIQMQTVTQEHTEDLFKVTIGRYYTVSGHTPQLEGVKADIVVPSNEANLRVGEEYLGGAIKPDTIAPSFHDPLTGIPPEKREWYETYYVPFLQQPTDRWRKFIPELKKRSAERLKKNQSYQNLLHGDFTLIEWHGLSEEEVALDPEAAYRALLNMQLQEAVNITKDLIMLSH